MLDSDWKKKGRPVDPAAAVPPANMAVRTAARKAVGDPVECQLALQGARHRSASSDLHGRSSRSFAGTSLPSRDVRPQTPVALGVVTNGDLAPTAAAGPMLAAAGSAVAQTAGSVAAEDHVGPWPAPASGPTLAAAGSADVLTAGAVAAETAAAAAAADQWPAGPTLAPVAAAPAADPWPATVVGPCPAVHAGDAVHAADPAGDPAGDSADSLPAGAADSDAEGGQSTEGPADEARRVAAAAQQREGAVGEEEATAAQQHDRGVVEEAATVHQRHEGGVVEEVATAGPTVAADVIADVAVDVIADVAVDVIADAAADVAAHVAADVAADVAVDVVADVTAVVAAKMGAGKTAGPPEGTTLRKEVAARGMVAGTAAVASGSGGVDGVLHAAYAFPPGKAQAVREAETGGCQRHEGVVGAVATSHAAA